MATPDITHRKAAEAALEQSERLQRQLALELHAERARLITAQAVARIGSWETDLSTVRVIWSEEMHKIYETTPETFTATHKEIQERIHPEDRAAVHAAFTRSISLSEIQMIEHRLLMPDGRIKYVEERWQSISDDEGLPLRSIGTCQDITDRKQAELEARRANETLTGIVAALQDITSANLTLQETMTLMAERAQVLTGATGAVIEMVEGQEMVYQAASGVAASKVGLRLPRSGSLSGLAVQSGTALLCDDAEAEERLARVGCRMVGSRSMVVAPLWDGPVVIGVFKVLSGQPRAFAKHDITTLQVMAESLGALIQRKQAEEAAERNHKRWRHIIDGLGPGIFMGLITPQGIVIECNRSALEPAGLTLDDVLGKPFDETYWWSYSPEAQQQLREAIIRAAHGEASRYDTQVRGMEHRLIDVDFSLRPLRSEDGEVVFLVPSATVISERKLAEHRLRESEERFSGAFQHAPIGVALVSPEGQFLKINRALCDLVGYSEAELLTRSFRDITHPDDMELSQDNMRRVMAGEDTAFQIEKRYVHARGHTITALLNVSLVRDSQGKARYFIAQVQDITARKQTETALRESNEKFHLLADNLIDAFWIRSPDMRELHYISPAFERIWGRPAAVLYADPGLWADYTLAEDRERVVAAFTALTSHDPSVDIEYRIVRPDGEIRWVRVRGFQVRDATDALIRLTGIVTDITEKKQLEAQFLRAQRMEGIGTLAGGIAHDLNNVLAAIVMSVDMLKDLARNEEDVGLLAMLQGSAQRGADLVKQVLTFARGVEGERITVNPIHLMGDLLKVMRDTFPKSINVGFTAAQDLWTVTGDPTQMHQVFLNLCVNARDAMPDGGNLTVSLTNIALDQVTAATVHDSRPGTYVMATVADTGTGIAPEIRDRIFEPFFTTKEVGKGTGLGLSTTQAIVKGHGGFIHVKSKLGKGTTFTVYLPANTTEAAVADVPIEPARMPRGNGELVLVVDDEEAIRNVTKRTLERFGYRVMLAVNGADAVGLYAQHRSEIAVVLTDLTMPIMDGPATIVALKGMNPAVKIIGSSGFASGGGVGKAVAAGLKHFLPKPSTLEDMLRMLREVLAEP